MAKKSTPSGAMRNFSILSLFLCAVLSLKAQTSTVQSRALSLEDCITVALEHNLTIQITRYNPMIAQYSLAGSYGDYEPTLSLSVQHDYSLSPGGVDDEGRPFGGNETDVDRISGGFQGLLPFGTTYNLGAGFSDRIDDQPLIGEFETTSGQVGALSLRQPLLKNFWIDPTRLNLYVSKRELSIRESDFRDQVDRMIVVV